MRAELYLTREFERKGLTAADLRRAVEATAERIAAEINARGLEAQIAYLIDDHLEPDEIRALVGAEEDEEDEE